MNVHCGNRDQGIKGSRDQGTDRFAPSELTTPSDKSLTSPKSRAKHALRWTYPLILAASFWSHLALTHPTSTATAFVAGLSCGIAFLALAVEYVNPRREVRR